jgi:hypothetical protein
MTIRNFQVTFDCADPRGLGSFWAQALGFVEDQPPPGFASWPEALAAWGLPEEEWNRAYAVVAPDDSGRRVFFQQVPEGKQAKNRVHLDVRVSDLRADPATREKQVLAEVDRLEALGARRLDWVEERGTHFMVMADVEGNEFCLT